MSSMAYLWKMELTKGQRVLLSKYLEFGFALLFNSLDASLNQSWSCSYLGDVQNLTWVLLV